MGFEIAEWRNLLTAWRNPQVAMSNVLRWQFFANTSYASSLRPQNVLQHSFSLVYLCDVLVCLLSPYVALDEVLLLRACYLHDVGESLVGEDVNYNHKRDEHDLAEYMAFANLYAGDERLWPRLQQAFLLQFAGVCPEKFPDDARAVMESLRLQKPHEILAFDAIQRWDYFLYPLEHAQDDESLDLLRGVAVNQCPELDRIAKLLPGFKEEVWTDEVSNRFRQFCS